MAILDATNMTQVFAKDDKVTLHIYSDDGEFLGWAYVPLEHEIAAKARSANSRINLLSKLQNRYWGAYENAETSEDVEHALSLLRIWKRSWEPRLNKAYTELDECRKAAVAAGFLSPTGPRRSILDLQRSLLVNQG